jgi:hypothetical protein
MPETLSPARPDPPLPQRPPCRPSRLTSPSASPAATPSATPHFTLQRLAAMPCLALCHIGHRALYLAVHHAGRWAPPPAPTPSGCGCHVPPLRPRAFPSCLFPVRHARARARSGSARAHRTSTRGRPGTATHYTWLAPPRCAWPTPPRPTTVPNSSSSNATASTLPLPRHHADATASPALKLRYFESSSMLVMR